MEDDPRLSVVGESRRSNSSIICGGLCSKDFGSLVVNPVEVFFHVRAVVTGDKGSNTQQVH